MNKPDHPELIAESQMNGVLTLTLGGGTAHALSLAMITALHDALQSAEARDDVRVILIHGPGRIFCAGHDMNEIARHRFDPDQGQAFVTRLFEACSSLMQGLAGLSKPTIALTEGVATAGGLQMLASCDLVFAAPEASFSLPGVSNGGFCTTPLVAVGRVLARKHAMEMALSGERFDTDWALSAGLINRVMRAETLLDEAREFAQQLAARHAPAISAGKAAFSQQMDLPLAQAYEVATQTMIGHFMDSHRIKRDRDNWG
ncbi:MAG: enoyl-CoA hydratase-related protein [Pseudomonadota bacterium]